jgi:hypothetical protein
MDLCLQIRNPLGVLIQEVVRCQLFPRDKELRVPALHVSVQVVKRQKPLTANNAAIRVPMPIFAASKMGTLGR